jgi:hypothetical protein
VIGGIVQNWFPLGATSIYGEYFAGTRHLNLSDPDMLNQLVAPGFDPVRCLDDETGEPIPCSQEIRESVNTAWGFGVVQKINDDREPGAQKDGAAKKAVAAKEAVMEVYLSYRHFEIDVDLIDTVGVVPTRKMHDFDLITTGAIVRF